MFENNMISMTSELNRIDDQKKRMDNSKFYLEQIGEFIRCNRKIQGFSQSRWQKLLKYHASVFQKLRTPNLSQFWEYGRH